MPEFEYTTRVRCSPKTAFDFLADPANVLLVTPPNLHAKLVEAPPRLKAGDKFTVQVRQFGFPLNMTNEVTAFEEGVSFTDSQVDGPFGRFAQTHSVAADGDGTAIRDHVDYETPGGMVGLYLTNERIRKDLEEMFKFREAKFKELLDGKG